MVGNKKALPKESACNLVYEYSQFKQNGQKQRQHLHILRCRLEA